MMKFLTVLLIWSGALLCISEVVSSPIQINNNNMGDVTSIKLDINGKIHSVINVVSNKQKIVCRCPSLCNEETLKQNWFFLSQIYCFFIATIFFY
jgi:hypothetical protein